MTDQTTPNQVTALSDALTNVTPECLAATLNTTPALKKKLATALCCESIDDVRELVASISDTKAEGRRGPAVARHDGKMALPFTFISKMQKFFIPSSAAVPDVKIAYRQNIGNYNRTLRNSRGWDGYMFRLLRKENGALLVKVPSPHAYTWAEAIAEYSLYGLAPSAADFLGHGNVTQTDFTAYRVEQTAQTA